MPVIKKYENRRLYDTEASRYVNLDEVAKMLADNTDVSVVDVKTGRDLTREILLQILVESGAGADIVPVSLLRRVIRAHGADGQTRLRREQLVLGLELLEAQLLQSEAYLDRLYEPLQPSPVMYVAEGGPPEEAWGNARAGAPRGSEPIGASAFDPHGAEELDELRAQLARLEQRLKR